MSFSILEKGHLYYWCPACKSMAHVPVDRWQWNGSLDKPTLTPSVKETCGPFPDGKILCCHYFLTDGVMNYCGDCTHGHSNEKIPLPDLDALITILPKIMPTDGFSYVRK